VVVFVYMYVYGGYRDLHVFDIRRYSDLEDEMALLDLFHQQTILLKQRP